MPTSTSASPTTSNTRFQSSTFNFDPAGIERLITDDRCLIGLSDGGAHVDFICDVGYATALLDSGCASGR